MRKIFLFLILTFLFSSCIAVGSVDDGTGEKEIVRSSKAEKLYNNLKALGSDSDYLFGQANARTISYSTTKNYDKDQSDCKDVAGAHPAFIESDFMWYYDDASFKINDVQAMKDHYADGGVIGYCWHMRDSSGDFDSTDNNISLCKDIVNDNGNSRSWFYGQIDSYVVPVLTELKDNDIPVIIRPFHEMNGGWFWWGSQSASDYINLYRLYVDYLRNTKGLDNLLFAWAPNYSFSSTYYPGDDYVDIVGLDYYEPTATGMTSQLNLAAAFAARKGKILALTETGYRSGGYGPLRIIRISGRQISRTVLRECPIPVK